MQKVSSEIRTFLKEKIQENADSNKLIFPIRPSSLSIMLDDTQIVHITRQVLSELGYKIEQHKKAATGNIKVIASPKH